MTLQYVRKLQLGLDRYILLIEKFCDYLILSFLYFIFKWIFFLNVKVSGGTSSGSDSEGVNFDKCKLLLLH